MRHAQPLDLGRAVAPRAALAGPAILGISAHYHDAAAALVRGGEVVAAAAEERFTRLKHDANFPEHAVRFCLDAGGLPAQDLDAVVFYEEPHVKFTRVMATTLAEFPRSARFFVGAMKRWLGGSLWTRNEISAALDVHPAKVVSVPHHESHAALAFFASPFDEAAILTIDGVGEWTCTSIAVGRGGDGADVEVIESSAYPNSLGLVYSAFSAFLGFRPNDGEASTMALASFGRPRFADEVRAIVRVAPDGRYRVDGRYFDFLSSERDLFTPAFMARFGAPRDFHQRLSFDCLGDAAPASADEQRYADIAASVQLVLEEAVTALAARAQRLTGARHLCLAGGVALNAVANTRLVEDARFDGVFIAPDPGDGGSAIGAALLAHHRRTPAPRRHARATPYLGRAYDSRALAELVAEVDLAAWAHYRLPGAAPLAAGRLDSARYDDEAALVEAIADALGRGRIVGWFQGRFELGPRALGNRSILADPADLDTVRRLSLTVKQRAAFRPYALSIRDEDIAEIFDFNGPIPQCARWMQMVKPVRPAALARVRGAVHSDGTTRLQACSAGDNPRFHRLLAAFAARRGLGALLNTSFNESGYPMVATPHEALLMFARSDMDILVVNELVIRKPGA